GGPPEGGGAEAATSRDRSRHGGRPRRLPAPGCRAAPVRTGPDGDGDASGSRGSPTGDFGRPARRGHGRRGRPTEGSQATLAVGPACPVVPRGRWGGGTAWCRGAGGGRGRPCPRGGGGH